MSTEEELNQTILQIRRMTTQPGDIVWIKMNPGIQTEHAYHLAEQLEDFANNQKIQFLISDNIDDIRKIPEKQLLKYGWIKK